MMIDESIRNLKSLNPTNDSIEEKVESFDEKPAVVDETVVPMDVMEEPLDEFDGWNAEDDDDDDDSDLLTKPSDEPVPEPRKTLIEMLKSATADGELNPALMVSVSIAPIFQADRPYKLTYNNISDEEFREMFWSSHEHEVTAICVDYSSGCLAFITGYQSFLDGIKTKSFYLSAKDIDKYDIRFTPYCTYAEAVNEYKSTLLKEEKKEKEK
jgi:hypothetical protein